MFQFSYNFNWKITLLSMNSAETGCITIFTFLPATPSTNMSRSKVTTLTHISLIQMSFVQWTTQVLACYLSLQMCQSHPVIHDGGLFTTMVSDLSILLSLIVEGTVPTEWIYLLTANKLLHGADWQSRGTYCPHHLWPKYWALKFNPLQRTF